MPIVYIPVEIPQDMLDQLTARAMLGATEISATQPDPTPASSPGSSPGMSSPETAPAAKTCKHGDMQYVPAGKSPANGKRYAAFWGCPAPRGQQCASVKADS